MTRHARHRRPVSGDRAGHARHYPRTGRQQQEGKGQHRYDVERGRAGGDEDLRRSQQRRRGRRGGGRRGGHPATADGRRPLRQVVHTPQHDLHRPHLVLDGAQHPRRILHPLLRGRGHHVERTADGGGDQHQQHNRAQRARHVAAVERLDRSRENERHQQRQPERESAPRDPAAATPRRRTGR